MCFKTDIAFEKHISFLTSTYLYLRSFCTQKEFSISFLFIFPHILFEWKKFNAISLELYRNNLEEYQGSRINHPWGVLQVAHFNEAFCKKNITSFNPLSKIKDLYLLRYNWIESQYVIQKKYPTQFLSRFIWNRWVRMISLPESQGT